MPYRRRLDDVELWHCCINCSSWPKEKYLWLLQLPNTDLICPECRERERLGECVKDNPE